MALIDIIQSGMSRFSDSDPNWRQFVLDHKGVILQNAEVVNIIGDVMHLVNYSIRNFLQQPQLRRDPGIDWIVRLINNLKSDIDFVDVRLLYVPQINYLTTLYQLYQTTTALQPKT